MAEQAKVIEFRLPKRKPKVVEKVAPPDQRKFAVLPMSAVMDTELHGFTVKVLAVLCSYCNRAGLTWVGQQRIADHLGAAKQQVARAMKQLRDRGHIQVVSKGFRGEKANTVRVIFDDTVSTEDAIAVTSGQEDTRPPEIRKREARAMTKQSEHDTSNVQGKEDDFTPEQMAANRARFREMLGGLAGRDGTFHYNKPENMGAIMARKQIKDGPKTTPKRTKKAAAIDNAQVVHEQPSIDNIIDNNIDNSGVVQTRKNIGYTCVIGLYEEIIKERFNTRASISEFDTRMVALLCETHHDDHRIESALANLDKPEALGEICDRVIRGA